MTFAELNITFFQDINFHYLRNQYIILLPNEGHRSIISSFKERRLKAGDIPIEPPTSIVGEISAMNYAKYFNLDYAKDKYIATSIGNVVNIKSLVPNLYFFISARKYEYCELKNSEYFGLRDVTFSKPPTIINKKSPTISTDECDKVVVNILASETIFKIISPLGIIHFRSNPSNFVRNRGETFQLTISNWQKKTFSTTITTPPLLEISNFEIGVTGSIVKIIDNTTANIGVEYSLDNTTWQGAGLFTELASGDYTLYIRDAYSCQISTSFTVQDSKIPDNTIPDNTIEECDTDCYLDLTQGQDSSCGGVFAKKYFQQLVLVNRKDILEYKIETTRVVLQNRHRVKFRLKEGKTGYRFTYPENGVSIFATFEKTVQEGHNQYTHIIQLPIIGVKEDVKYLLRQLDNADYLAAIQFTDGTVEIYGFEYGLITDNYNYDVQNNEGGSILSLISDSEALEDDPPFIYASVIEGNEGLDFDNNFKDNLPVFMGDFNNDFNN